MTKLIIYSFLSLLAAGGFWSVKDRFVAGETSKDLYLSLLHPIKTFDPSQAFNDDSLTVLGQSLETLYQYHYLKRPYEVIPSLADGKPKISKEGTVYEIKIKQRVAYHDQTEFFKKRRYVKAQDFINQFKRLAFKPLKSTGTWLFSGKIKGFDEFSERVGNDFDKMMSSSIEGLKAVDDHTLRIELTRPEPNMLYFLSMTFTTPVPEELILKYKNDLSKVVVGTGPFYLAQVSQEKLVFKKNQNYRDEFYPSAGDRYANTQDLLTSSTERLPFLERVVFYFIDDEERRWEAFIDGKIDILSVPKKFLVKITEGDPDIEELLRQKEIKLKHFSSISSRWLGFNMSDPVLGKNLELRKALAHAIDYDGYIALMSNNTNLRANSIFNPGIPGYDPSHQMSYDYDLDKARAHLEKSGFSPGELTLTYTTRSNQQINYEEAEFIKNQLGKIGVNLKINVVQFSEFLARGRAGELQFFTDSWIYDYPDAENLAQLLVSSNSPGINKSAYNNLQVDKLYSELSKTLDKDKRRALMAKIENFVDKEIPWVMLMFESSYILHYPNIKNFRKSYFIRNHLKYLKKE